MSIQNDKLMNLADGKVLYDDLRERIEAAEDDLEDLIAVQDETPTNPVTEIWMTETPPAGIQVPTYAEHKAVSNCIAPDYEDLTFPVAAGQHCIQNGKYYVTENGIQTSEAWTPAHWLEVPNVGEEFEDVKSALNSKADEPTGMKVANYVYSLDSNLDPVWAPQSGGGQSDIGLSVVNGEICVTYEEASA